MAPDLSSPEFCRQKAEECLALSYQLTDPKRQVAVLKLANSWMRLAEYHHSITQQKAPDLENGAWSSKLESFYGSPNGDRWLLAREPDSGRVFVRHIPNLPSGGRTTDIEIGAFLCERSYGPQHMELLRLIGTLIEEGKNLEAAARS
jgi:hypothetical protein